VLLEEVRKLDKYRLLHLTLILAVFPLAAGVAATKYGAFVVEPVSDPLLPPFVMLCDIDRQLAMATLGFVLVFWVGAQIVSKLGRK
jgi:hypothetical protein